MSPVINYLDEHEIGLCLRINRFARIAQVRQAFAVVSRLGDGLYWFAMAAVMLYLHGIAAAPDLLRILLTCVLGIGIYKALKDRLVRERPFVYNGEISCGTAPLDRYSFPSGHTLHAVSFTLMYAALDPVFYLLCAPFAVLVMLSRIVLGLHYPSDVLVGAGIGMALASVSIALA